jgi:hypothetical protein
MVTITVFFEGGVHPNDKNSALTLDNSTLLRESFNQLLNSGLSSEKVKIQAIPAASVTNIVKIRKENSLLLLDLDAPKSKREERIKASNLSDIQEYVFFMIQKMEAWILSQPKSIEDYFKDKKINENEFVKDDESIHGKNCEDIIHPDRVLQTILKRYFSDYKGDKFRKLEYGKLKHAPNLIKNLDIHQLKKDFEDVRNLLDKVEKMSIL